MAAWFSELGDVVIKSGLFGNHWLTEQRTYRKVNYAISGPLDIAKGSCRIFKRIRTLAFAPAKRELCWGHLA
jgi:hypothetical protein